MFVFFKWCCCRCFLSVSGAVCFIYNLRGDLSQITEIPGNEKKEVKGHKKTRLHGKSMNILREVWMSSDSELAHHSTQNLIILNKHHHNHFRTVIHSCFVLFMHLLLLWWVWGTNPINRWGERYELCEHVDLCCQEASLELWFQVLFLLALVLIFGIFFQPGHQYQRTQQTQGIM